ncbi:hypothetical protein [Streptomyces silvisoli]|uniref:SGNH/GDSL hydrolase family protein n=1 Tax=Streptomyces silvisoli TaxID=3034235 RepID=A0ABT5ZLA9_9ACTN|nr:hypothetical protein [Streptomyces silvisoli]MDF3290609.1 hypothetical protein [Streptomyces silvisoli]
MRSPSLWRPRWRAVTLITALAVAAVGTVVIWQSRSAQEGESVPPSQTIDLPRRIGEHISGLPKEGGYRIPGRGERRAIATGVALVLDKRLDAARQRLAAVGYTVRTLRVSGTDREVAEVAESPATHRGWGWVYVDLAHPVRWSVQAPHPRSDLYTELLAGDLFTRAPGGVLVLAGAPRNAGEGNAADVAHREDSVFGAVCDMLVARGLPAIQVHGFADASSPDHDVIVSPGPAEPSRPVREAARLLSDKGFRVCRVWRERCSGLEGTTNAQGNKAADNGVPFLHVENSFTVRADPASRQRVADALAAVARGWE